MTYDNQPEEIRVVYPLRAPGPFGPTRTTRDGISAHTIHARMKHPWKPGVSSWYKTRVLLSEVREFLWAVFVERDPERVRDEGLDVCAVLVRWIERDGDGETRHD